MCVNIHNTVKHLAGFLLCIGGKLNNIEALSGVLFILSWNGNGQALVCDLSSNK